MDRLRNFIILLVLSTLIPAAPVSAGKGRLPSRGGIEVKSHRITAEIDPDSSYIRGEDTIRIFSGGTASLGFLLNRNLSITAMDVNGRFFSFSRGAPSNIEMLPGFEGIEPSDLPGGPCLVRLNLGSYGKKRGEMTLRVRYEGRIYDPVGVGEFSREYIADQTSGIISAEGTFLGPSTFWYPFIPGALCRHTLETITPAGTEVVTQGVLRVHELSADSLSTRSVWDARRRSDGLYLVAGPYEIHSRIHGPVELLAYLYESDADIAPMLLDRCADFIRLYEKMLAPYPFGKFAVVENFFPTGYGMPSYTLIGSAIIRLPFLIKISLGHEIAHNWWGNSVYVDYDSGNWCEGLTSYCADYYYREMESEEAARLHRRDLLRDYVDYVNETTDFPLVEFTSRTTPGSRAVGYGKAAMVFHQVRRRMGDELFFKALRRVIDEKQWEITSWDDFRIAFEKEGDLRLGRFFDQWLTQPGAPTLHLASVEVVPGRGKAGKSGGERKVRVTIRQDEPVYDLRVPVKLVSPDGYKIERVLVLDSTEGAVEIPFPESGGSVIVDPGFDVFRKLLPGETAPTLSKLLGDERTIFVIADGLPDSLAEAYRFLAGRLRHGSEIQVFEGIEKAASLLADNPYLLLGPYGSFPSIERYLPELEAEWAEKITGGGRAGSGKGGGSFGPGPTVLSIREHPGGRSMACGIFAGDAPGSVRGAGRKLPHYGKYTDLLFKGSRNIGKKVRDPDNSPMTAEFKVGS